MKYSPNIAISGNPGVGKTTLAKRLAGNNTSLRYLDFGNEAIKRGFHDGWDEELQCHIVEYDELAHDLEASIALGGYIIDWIHADFWPLDGSIDLVVTVTCDNTILFDRYKARGYDQAKINENLDSEIMEEIVDENQAYFGQEPDGSSSLTTLIKLKGESEEDMEHNLTMLNAWMEKWRRRHNVQANGTTKEEDDETPNENSNHNQSRVSIDQISS